MNKKIYTIFFLTILFSLTFISAQPSTTIYAFPQGYTIVPTEFEQLKVGEDFNFFFYLYNSSNGLKIDNSTVSCYFHLADSQGNLVLNEQEAYQPNGYWFTTINGSYVNKTGYYYYGVDCTDGLSGAISGVIEVTTNGEGFNGVKLSSLIFLILLCGFLIFIIAREREKVNFEKWNNNNLRKYENKNYIKMVLSILTYNLMKNVFIIYYLIGLLIVALINNLLLSINSTLVPLMEIIMGLYTWGLIIVGIVVFSKVQEWIMEWKEQIQNINWGFQ